MVNLLRYLASLICLILFIFFSHSYIFAAPSDTEFQKVIATYGLWTVVINFMDVSNPRCQVKGVAATADVEYKGPVTFWKEQYKGNLSPVVEISLFKDIDSNNFIPLKKDPGAHILMIKKMNVRGVRRETAPYMALFNVGHGMVKEMAETDIAIATLIDLKGKEYDLLILMEGFKEAWSLCDSRQ